MEHELVWRSQALRAAFAQFITDPVFEAEFESTVQGQLDPRTGVDLAVIVERALETPESTLEAAKTILGLD